MNEKPSRRNQNFRRKNKSSFLEEETTVVVEESENVVTQNTSVPVNGVRKQTNKENEERIPTKLSKLSFNDDQEEDPFKIRKSKLSRKIQQKEKKKTLKSLLNPDVAQSDKVENKAPTWVSGSADDYSADKLAQLKKEFTVRIKHTVPETTSDSTQLFVSSDLSAIPTKKPNEDIFEVESMDTQTNLQSVTVIPTQERILEIKNRRKNRARIGSDFVPIFADDNDGDNSRLIREDDDDDEDERNLGYGDRRIKFGDPGKDKKTLYEIEDQDDEDDEESKKWEDDQLAKSGFKIPIYSPDEKHLETGSVRPHYDPLAFEPPSIEQITKQIRSNLGNMMSVHSEHQIQYNKILNDISDSRRNLESLKLEANTLKEESIYFSNYRSYIMDLSDCLEKKSKILGELENKANLIGINIADSLRKTRRNFVDDELEEIRTIMGEQQPPPASLEKQERIKLRKGIRRRRQEDRKMKVIKDPEGWSSDEDETLFEDYIKARESAVENAELIFSDTNEEYSSLSFIVEKFEEWRIKFPNIYEQSFGTLSLSIICEIFIRHEILLKWDLFKIEEIDFPNMEWYQILLDFGAQTQNIKKKDEDENFLPNLIADIVMEKVKFIFTHFYDPFSQSQTERGIKIVKTIKIFEEVPSISQKMKEVIMAIRVTLQGAAESSVVISPPKIKNVGPVREFCERQFWSAVKLFTTCAGWYGLLPLDVYEYLCYNILLNSKLLPYMRNMDNERDVIEAAIKIVTVITPNYIITGENTVPPTLIIFRDFIENYAKHIHQKYEHSQETEYDNSGNLSKEVYKELLDKSLRVLIMLNDHKTVILIEKRIT